MPYYTFEYVVPYPKANPFPKSTRKESNEKKVTSLLTVGSDSTQLLYSALNTVTLENVNKVIKKIREDINRTYPQLCNDPRMAKFPIHLDEIIKNCFDAVNNAKANGADIDQIHLKLVLSDAGNQLTIKIKDNGTGFAKLQKSESVSLSTFLTPKKSGLSGLLSNLFNKTSTPPTTIESDKPQLKFLGKKFLLGGAGIGLAQLNQDMLQAGVQVSVKNRKNGGATITFQLELAVLPKYQNDVDNPDDKSDLGGATPATYKDDKVSSRRPMTSAIPYLNDSVGHQNGFASNSFSIQRRPVICATPNVSDKDVITTAPRSEQDDVALIKLEPNDSTTQAMLTTTEKNGIAASNTKVITTQTLWAQPRSQRTSQYGTTDLTLPKQTKYGTMDLTLDSKNTLYIYSKNNSKT